VPGTSSLAALAFTGALGAGCAHVTHDVPAVVTDPTAESRAEIRRVVSQALHGAPLTLADNVLTRDSTLIVERARPRDESGVPLVGRDTGRPERFRLVKDGARCVLVHEGTGERYPLAATTCEAEE
jgi:hypothetical protein